MRPLWTSDRPSDSAECRQLWDGIQHERRLQQRAHELEAWQLRLQVWTALLCLAAAAFGALARALGRL